MFSLKQVALWIVSESDVSEYPLSWWLCLLQQRRDEPLQSSKPQ